MDVGKFASFFFLMRWKIASEGDTCRMTGRIDEGRFAFPATHLRHVNRKADDVSPCARRDTSKNRSHCAKSANDSHSSINIFRVRTSATHSSCTTFFCCSLDAFSQFHIFLVFIFPSQHSARAFRVFAREEKSFTLKKIVLDFFTIHRVAAFRASR